MGDLMSIAARCARIGGQVIAGRFSAARALSWKVQDGVASIVTDADLAAEAAIREFLASVCPDDLVLAEEGASVDARAPRLWVVDPLDGSTNYARGNPVCCVSVAYAEAGEVLAAAVYDPFRRELFTARRGKGARRNGRPVTVTTSADLREAVIACGAPSPRRPDAAAARRLLHLATEQVYRVRVYGSTALELCWVAAGRLEGAVNWNSHWWDVAAAALILTEAGGAFSPAAQDWGANPTCTTSIGSNGPLQAALEGLARRSVADLRE
ncbi:MAG: inositol monophosphatase [Chloroflexi bacterium]|nr:inositol monophosphatase [Chloroflexota bacterium]